VSCQSMETCDIKGELFSWERRQNGAGEFVIAPLGCRWAYDQ